MIVIAAVERIRTRLNGALGVGGPAVQLEKRFRTDKATVPQFLCDLRDRRAVCNGDGHLCVRLGQGQHIVRAAPRKHGKQHRRGQHAAHIQQHPDAGRQPSVLFFLRRFRLLRLLVDGQIRVFLRDLRLEQRRHIGRLLLRLRLLLQLGLGLRFGRSASSLSFIIASTRARSSLTDASSSSSESDSRLFSSPPSSGDCPSGRLFGVKSAMCSSLMRGRQCRRRPDGPYPHP